MRNRGQSKQRTGRSGRGPRRAAEEDEAAAIAAALSDSDLDADLMDYLQNVHQQQQDSSDGAGQPQQHMQTNRSNGERTAAHTSAAQLGSTLQGDPADAEDPDSWRPTGLGYHPQHGFASASAAAQFADTSLDHMLQGNFARDMQGAVDYDSTDSGSGFDSSGSDSDDDSTTSSSGSSNSDGEGDEEGFAGSGFGGSEPVVVDATGRQQRWHDLSLEQLFPVQSRQGLSSQAAAAAGGGGGGSSARGSKQKQRPPSGSMRDALAQNISTSMLLSNRQGSIPEFHSEGLAAAVAAATSAAAELAKQQVAQYAELAQQLQRAKQNQRQRPGRQGKGVKKQLKKAKVAAKRTAREARSEAGALQLLAALEAFVGSGQDVQVLPPCGSRQKEGFAKQLARFFGVAASSQGGGSSGRTCLVLQATPDLQQQQQQQQLLDESRLAQLQALLRGELAKELAAATIARDDTVHNLKRKEKQRRRSFQQQQSGMQRQGSRGPPGRIPTPDYQQPVLFVAAGVLDPNSSLVNHDEYMDSDTAAAAATADSADDTESGSSSSSDDNDSGPGSDAEAKGVGRGAAAAAGRTGVGSALGPSHAEVGAFLESLLLQEEDQETSPVAPAAAAAAVQGPQEEQDVQPAWLIDRAGSRLQEGVAGCGGVGFGAVAADRVETHATRLAENPQQQQQQQQTQDAVAGTFVTTVYEDRGPQQQQQQQQGADTDSCTPGSSSAAFVPTCFEDKGPERTVYSQGARGLTFIAAGTSDDDFAQHERLVASSSAAAAGLSTRDRGEHEEGPVYDRAGLGLGFGLGPSRPGLGLVAAAAAAETDIDVLLGLPREEEVEEDSDGGGWERAGLGRRQGRRKGVGSSSRDRVAQLEAEFKSLQTPGGRAAAAAAAAGVAGQQAGGGSKQERKQRRKQQQQKQRAPDGGGANLDAWMLAAGATAAAVDAQPSFNMTAQQSKKAKKQQQRNQRREAKAAGGAGSPAAAEGVGMQHQQQQAVGFATFEVHTTGIGSRLLSRWGWSEGEGLGRARQGRADPLQAERRPKQLGLGYE